MLIPVATHSSILEDRANLINANLGKELVTTQRNLEEATENFNEMITTRTEEFGSMVNEKSEMFSELLAERSVKIRIIREEDNRKKFVAKVETLNGEDIVVMLNFMSKKK